MSHVQQPQATRASVIVVNYNGGEELIQCIGSLMPSCSANDEVILVDNASTDGSADAVEQTFPDVRVIRSKTNLGFGGGNNLGMRVSTGEYLVFLNPDTLVNPGWLDALLAALDENPQVGTVTSKILLLNDRGRINTCGNDTHASGLTLCRGLGLPADMLNEPAEVGAVSGAAFAMRREIYELLGGFDESFFLYMEDTDLSWRARLLGDHPLYVPDSIVYHDYALRFGPQKTFYQERNRYLMLLKTLRWRTLLGLLPVLLLAETVTWGFVLLREPNRLQNKLRAYAWIVRHWPQVMEKRKQTQALRRISDRDLLACCTHRLTYEQTGDSAAARLAHALLDPLFLVSQRIALAVMEQ
ncbi:MAG: glycosyltransferase family 2 protein [Chloroflexi bacterium]|jgi:GT2 family glycosyltransferase|nr:glycosyltransferase family 2 protein [Chloroflexota bacterium]